MDYKEMYADLTAKLEKEIPFVAFPIRELVQQMRIKGSPITLKSELTITSVYNSGDISGILCAFQNGEKGVAMCGLSHLIFPHDFILYKEIEDYQKKRAKRVQHLNRK